MKKTTTINSEASECKMNAEWVEGSGKLTISICLETNANYFAAYFESFSLLGSMPIVPLYSPPGSGNTWLR